MSRYGKSIFIHKGLSCFGGDIARTAAFLRNLGIDTVLLKIGDMAYNHSSSYPDMETSVKMFRACGIDVGVWHYVYGGAYLSSLGDIVFTGHSPEQEAIFAKIWVDKLKPSIYIIDAEKEYKYGHGSSTRSVHPASRAGRFMTALIGMKCPVALSSFRYPSLHPEFPFSTFLTVGRKCDLHMPQVYWGSYATNAGVLELKKSYDQLIKFADLEFVPVGRAYIGDGHGNKNIIGQQITEFGAALQNMQGVSFWFADHLIQYGGSEWAEAIKGIVIEPHEQPEPPPEPPKPVDPVPTNVIVMEVLTDVNVRNQPSTVGNNPVGSLSKGEIIHVREIHGSDAWAETVDGKFVCIKRSIRYLRSKSD